MTRFVDVETPYTAKTIEGVRRNIRYARACVRDCLLRGEVPYASHLFFTQTGILDDNVQGERERGIVAGKDIIRKLSAVTVVYTDLGTSGGMQIGIDLARQDGRPIEHRTLGDNWEEEFSKHEGNHSHNGIW